MNREYWYALALSLALSVGAIAVGHRMGYCAGYANGIGADWQFSAGGCRLGVSGVFVPLDGFFSKSELAQDLHDVLGRKE